MRVSLIAALAQNGVIGRDNQLPWRLRADLQHFKRLTMGKPIIMGRRTWESIGRALPGRTNIVVTRDTALRAEGGVVVHSIEQALEAAGNSDEVFIIGGANLYAQTLPLADRLYLTRVKAEVAGDSWFPELVPGEWREVRRDSIGADEHNEYACDFVVLERRSPSAVR